MKMPCLEHPVFFPLVFLEFASPHVPLQRHADHASCIRVPLEGRLAQDGARLHHGAKEVGIPQQSIHRMLACVIANTLQSMISSFPMSEFVPRKEILAFDFAAPTGAGTGRGC